MIKFFNRILKYSGKYKGRILSAVFFAVIKGICVQMPIFVAYMMFNGFYEGTMTIARCWIYAGILVGVVAVNFAANCLSDVLQSTAGYKLFADKRLQLGDHLRKLPMGYFTSGNIGKISSVLGSDMIFVEENVMQSLAEMLGHAFASLMMTAFMFGIDWRIGLVVAGVSLIVMFVGKLMNASALKHSRIRQEQNENLTEAVITHIEGIGVIKSYNMLGEKSKDLTDNFTATKDAALKFEFSQIPWMVGFQLLYAVGMAGVLALSLYLYFAGILPLPPVIGTVLFVFSMFMPLKALYGDLHRLTIMDSCLDRTEKIFGEKQLDDNGGKKIPAQGNGAEIDFSNVVFSYGNEDTIKGVSFSVQRNSMVALVGPSGGGKTTLANLLSRFWDIKSGSIKVRGVDIRDMQLSELMNHISMVFQRVYLFRDTVYNNIVMGRPTATKDEVIEAAKKARCYDFIMELSDDFDTVIGEGGATLSGGEKQRISIARCILKDSPIVILDEATASVDADNEIYIQQAISELCKGKTLIVIAHRLNTIRNASQIVVVADGKVAECGTHDELMKEKGIYNNFVTLREGSKTWYQVGQ